MAREEDPLELIASEPDTRLLGQERGQLPGDVRQPPQPLPESPARRQVVRFGATMTGVTLIGGVALAVAGLVEAIANGGLAWILVLILGIVLVLTHWGWVHVAELTGNRIEARRQAPLEERRRHWLSEIEPYSRWEVVTHVDEDGAITIETIRHRPVGHAGTFTFVREVEGREVHSGDEPAATVTERAELLRREAAANTTQARERFETARDAYAGTLLAQNDEEQRRAALRAASEALSERINSNLRDPPLTE
jgi:hypothetical protein